MAVKQTAGRNSLGDLAPKFAELNDDVLFGEVWSREDKLSLRDRCIVTVTALMAKGITDNSIKYHIENAKNHGVTKTEMVEIITHAAFYVGWPNAWAVFPMVREVYAEEKDGCSDSLFGLGEPNVNFAQYFIGNSYLKPLNVKGVGVFNVTFEPKCRNNWHIHHKGGQILLCTDGDAVGQGEGQAWVGRLRGRQGDTSKSGRRVSLIELGCCQLSAPVGELVVAEVMEFTESGGGKSG
jgi:4-carboxymuconolactone decarboxylase